MAVEIRQSGFEPHAELQLYERKSAQRGRLGAAVTFVGTMRDFNDGTPVSAMELEHYPGMTEKNLAQIADEAQQRWDVIDTLIVHRVGSLIPGEPIVLVAVWASHRGPAFEACRYLIEELKSRAPFWKKEQTGVKTRWVEKNSPGI